MKNIFDWLKEINYKKSPVESFTEKDWEVWNSYMIHRFISMDKNFIDIVNYVQDYPPYEKRSIYKIYKEYIPKNSKWNKYIKSNKKTINKELTQHLKDHFKVSSREINDYLNMLSKNEINQILVNRGLNKKEIKKINK